MDCYCVCHSVFSSRAACDHCQGKNEVGEYHRLRKKVIEALGYTEVDGSIYNEKGIRDLRPTTQYQISNLVNLILYEKL